MIDALAHFPHQRRTLVFTGCDPRGDDDVVAMGALIGAGFDRVILYEDRGNRGRADGELNALLRRGLGDSKRVSKVIDIADEMAAVEFALQQLRPGDLVVLGVASIGQATALVQAAFGARGAKEGVRGAELEVS